MRHYACAILLKEGRILLGKRSPHRRAYAGCWDVIGGLVEPGEDLDAALHRELAEEIGIVPAAYGHLHDVIDRGPQARGEATYHMFLVRDWTGVGPLLLDDEHTELACFTIDEACALPDLALADYVAVFRLILASPGTRA